MKHILSIGVVFVGLVADTAAAQNLHCDIDIERAISNAGATAAESAYQQLQLTDPPNTGDLSCVEALLDYSVDILISIPNLADVLADAIEKGCNAAQQRIDQLTGSQNFQFDSNRILQGAGLPGGDLLFNNRNSDAINIPGLNGERQTIRFDQLTNGRQFNSQNSDILKELFK